MLTLSSLVVRLRTTQTYNYLQPNARAIVGDLACYLVCFRKLLSLEELKGECK